MQHLDTDTAHRFLRGTLEPADADRWAAHLRGCARCRDLVECERQMLALLELGEQPLSASQADAAGPPGDVATGYLDRLPHFSKHARRRRRRLAVASATLGLAAVFLAGLLMWQWRRVPDERGRLADEQRITPQLQDRVVAQLAALATLEANPWIAREYEAAEAFEQLLAEGGAL